MEKVGRIEMIDGGEVVTSGEAGIVMWDKITELVRGHNEIVEWINEYEKERKGVFASIPEAEKGESRPQNES